MKNTNSGIYKDTSKKNYLFERTRNNNSLEDRITAINQKLGTAIQFGGIHHFKIIYGSNLIEIKYNSNPSKSYYYTSKQFLDLNFINSKQVSDNKKIDKRRYDKIFERIEFMRESKEVSKFIEAFRINSSRDDLWFHFKDSRSCHIDSKSFIKNKQFKHLGQEEEFKREVLTENLTFYDLNKKEIHKLLKKQLKKNLITSAQCYLGSGFMSVVPRDNLYSWNGGTFKNFLENPDGFLEKGEDNSSVFKKRVFEVLNLGENLRKMDDELYLRILEGNVYSGKILTSYSCGGTYYNDIEEIINFKKEQFKDILK